MRKLIYIITLCLPLVTIAQTEIKTKTNFDGRHCRGDRGACSFELQQKGMAFNSSLKYEPNQGLILTLYVDKLSQQEVLKAVGKPLHQEEGKSKNLELLVEASFELDNTLLSALRIPKEQLWIEANKYPVTYKDNLLIITFKID